jgi:hypothetical protein
VAHHPVFIAGSGFPVPTSVKKICLYSNSSLFAGIITRCKQSDRRQTALSGFEVKKENTTFEWLKKFNQVCPGLIWYLTPSGLITSSYLTLTAI